MTGDPTCVVGGSYGGGTAVDLPAPAGEPHFPLRLPLQHASKYGRNARSERATIANQCADAPYF